MWRRLSACSVGTHADAIFDFSTLALLHDELKCKSSTNQLMVVGSEALAGGESPPLTLTVLVTLEGAVGETFTVTVIAG